MKYGFKRTTLTGIFFISTLSFVCAPLFLKMEGLKKFSFFLEDGESLDLYPIVDRETKSEVFLKDFYPALNSAILRSFDTQNNQTNDLITYAKSVSEYRSIGYWSIIPESRTYISDPTYAFPNSDSKSYNWEKIKGFENYYHSLFQSKTARKILFQQAVDIVISLCKSFPSDFKTKVLREIENLISFTSELKIMSSTLPAKEIGDYWMGFIYRRHHTDKVPISEIQESLLYAQNQIKAIDVIQQPEAMFEIQINNQISMYYSSSKIWLYSKSSGKRVAHEKSINYSGVKYFKDQNGEYYRFMVYEHAGQFSILYDKNLNEIR